MAQQNKEDGLFQTNLGLFAVFNCPSSSVVLLVSPSAPAYNDHITTFLPLPPKQRADCIRTGASSLKMELDDKAKAGRHRSVH